MITEYNRPDTIEEALKLLARNEPETYPLAGGSSINQPTSRKFAVVDLQSLKLDNINEHGKFLDMGATLTLQSLIDFLKDSDSIAPEITVDLVNAIQHEASYNLRQVATVAGTLMAADGRSPFVTVLLALDARLYITAIEEASEEIKLGSFLPLRQKLVMKRLITKIEIPLNVQLVYEYTARTPADAPIVCAAICSWPTGRTRMALGGYGDVSVMVFDGTEKSGLKTAAQDAYSTAEDEWASAEYRKSAAGILAERCYSRIYKNQT